MGRRGAGEGAVYQDRTTGLWVGSVEIPSRDGTRRRKVVRAKNKDRMLAKLRAVHALVDAGGPIGGGRATVAEWCDFWCDEVLPGTVTDQTVINYRQRLATGLLPYIGHIPLDRLAPEDVHRGMRALEARGLAPSSRADARTTLVQALNQAMAWGKVSRNVASLVRAPATAGYRLDDALDADEAGQVLEAAAGDRLEALAMLVLTTGLRQGEALRLRWADVDLTAGTVRVAKAKTPAGVRTVALPPMAVDALRRHRTAQKRERMAAPLWVDRGLVFTTEVGTGLPRRSVLRWWHNLTTGAEVGRRRFHASRHTAATLMLNNGVPLEVVSATLGHAGLAITADIYAKVRPQLQRTAATAMEAVLGGSSPKAQAP